MADERIFAEDTDDLTEPFLGLRPKGFICDYEYLFEIGSILLRAGVYPKEIVINVTDNMSALSWMDGWMAPVFWPDLQVDFDYLPARN